MRLTLADLRDRAGLQDCMNRYAQGVDQRQWPLYDSAFAPGAQVEVPGYMQGTLGFVAFRGMLADTFDAARLSGQHFLGNMHASIAGERAHAVTEFVATTVEVATSGSATREVTAGLYVDDFERTDGVWRIVHHRIMRKSADAATLPFAPPIADAVRFTLTADWAHALPLIPGHS